MRLKRIALTGPQAAAVAGLDGYRDHDWPLRWCVPVGGTGGPDVIRTRHWVDPEVVGNLPLAPPRLFLRHLDTTPARRPDRLPVRDRVELALEHALRTGVVDLASLRTSGGCHPGDQLLRPLLLERGDEPATGSYAETRALQFLRALGYRAWRQVEILRSGRRVHVADFLLPFDQHTPRPLVVRPSDGVLFEVDGRGPHAPQFERDHARDSAYAALGFELLTATPTQIERRDADVAAAIHRRMRRGHRR